MAKVKVKFIETVVVDDHRKGGKGEVKFTKDKSYEFEEASAAHWVTRGKAVLTGSSAR